MELISTITPLISTLGFPIVMAGALGVFIFFIYRDWNKSNQEREERLYNEIAENRKVIAQALNTMSLYNERLGIIEADVKEIKEIIQEEN